MAYSKYRAKIVETEDGPFHSQGEYARWCELKLLERAGTIRNLERQVTCVLRGEQKTSIGKIVVDFAYDNEQGVHVLEDFKGMTTPLAAWKLRHLAADCLGFQVIVSQKGKAPKRVAA